MQKSFESQCRVQYGLKSFLTDLMFANGSVIFANIDIEVTNILNHVAGIVESCELKINIEKIKAMTTDGFQVCVQLNGAIIQQMQEFKNLGSVVREKKWASMNEIHSRIGQAAAAVKVVPLEGV